MISESEQNVIPRLRGLLEDCGPGISKHDLAIILITACIDEGLNTRPRIVGALKSLGFNSRHVAIVLKYETGDNPESKRWQVRKEGVYCLLDERNA